MLQLLHIVFLEWYWIPTWVNTNVNQDILSFWNDIEVQKSYLNLSSEFLHYHYANISALYFVEWLVAKLGCISICPTRCFLLTFQETRLKYCPFESNWSARSYLQPTREISSKSLWSSRNFVEYSSTGFFFIFA